MPPSLASRALGGERIAGDGNRQGDISAHAGADSSAAHASHTRRAARARVPGRGLARGERLSARPWAAAAFSKPPEQLDDVAVERALGVVDGLLPVLVLRVDLGARVQEDLQAGQALVHRGPHQGGLAPLRARLERAAGVDEDLEEALVVGLDGAEECRLAVGVLVVDLGPARNEELADLLAAELRGQKQRRLAVLRGGIDLGLLLDQGLHRRQVALRGRPHQRRLVLDVLMVRLGAVVHQEVADLDVAVRRRLLQRGLPLLRGILRRHVLGLHQHLADLRLACQGRPHEDVPALVVLEIDGRALVEQVLHDVALALLRRLHQRSDALVVLGVEDALLLELARLLGVAHAEGAFPLRGQLRLDEILYDVQLPLLARLHERRLTRVVLRRDPRALLDQELDHVHVAVARGVISALKPSGSFWSTFIFGSSSAFAHASWLPDFAASIKGFTTTWLVFPWLLFSAASRLLVIPPRYRGVPLKGTADGLDLSDVLLLA
eukprot:CAMPEP_0176209778 /NCGR_PEP_ID=MMETSP0121_2-20121125/13805_1 /TAXON_ID=160619 /ORGANISM="Kryptoperidinium foliaceum, Strain CCMP 1326" /LENGTH=493 /DNA_ID=CAMNT_0017548793 /DNA_START=130 /DNA_END=1609 /DNA_ORIENTATION=+